MEDWTSVNEIIRSDGHHTSSVFSDLSAHAAWPASHGHITLIRRPRCRARDAYSIYKTTIQMENRAQCEIRSSWDRLPLKSSACFHIYHVNLLLVKVSVGGGGGGGGVGVFGIHLQFIDFANPTIGACLNPNPIPPTIPSLHQPAAVSCRARWAVWVSTIDFRCQTHPW
jgi:hypothetical protein